MSDTDELPIDERKYRDELALKWADIEIRKKELVLKEEEAKTNRGKWLWMSPTQATLMIAVIGLAASAFGAGLTAFTQLKIEKTKEQNATELAQMENAQKLLSPDIDSNSMADLTRRLAIYIKFGLIPDPKLVLSTLTNDQLVASSAPSVAATSRTTGARPQSATIIQPNVSTDFGEDRPGVITLALQQLSLLLASNSALLIRNVKHIHTYLREFRRLTGLKSWSHLLAEEPR